MKVKEDKEWAEQLAEFQADELSKKFGAFLVEWADTVDRLYSEVIPGKLGGSRKYGEYEAVSKALELTEQTHGYLSVEWIGQMLLLISSHWVHGDEMVEQMSFVEQRLLDQTTAMKLIDLAEGAKMDREQ